MRSSKPDAVVVRISRLLRDPFDGIEVLTRDEHKVAVLAARDGLTLGEIEHKTGVPWPTVGSQLQSVRKKLGLVTRPGKQGSLQGYLIDRIREAVEGGGE